jgi:hypothetical protein
VQRIFPRRVSSQIYLSSKQHLAGGGTALALNNASRTIGPTPASRQRAMWPQTFEAFAEVNSFRDVHCARAIEEAPIRNVGPTYCEMVATTMTGNEAEGPKNV